MKLQNIEKQGGWVLNIVLESTPPHFLGILHKMAKNRGGVL